MLEATFRRVHHRFQCLLLGGVIALGLLATGSCASVRTCPREIPGDQLLLSITQNMRGAVSYRGHFAEVRVDCLRVTGFRKRSCSRMDPEAFDALKELLASDEFRREFAITEAKNYTHMAADEPLLMVTYDGRQTSIAFSRLWSEGLAPLLARADSLIEGSEKIKNGTAAFPSYFGRVVSYFRRHWYSSAEGAANTLGRSNRRRCVTAGLCVARAGAPDSGSRRHVHSLAFLRPSHRLPHKDSSRSTLLLSQSICKRRRLVPRALRGSERGGRQRDRFSQTVVSTNG
jgi:hypothetical protein